MPMDEVIRGIEQTDCENIQDVLQAVIGRYRELYPQWRILLISADMNAVDEHSRKLLDLIREADEMFDEKLHGNMNEK